MDLVTHLPRTQRRHDAVWVIVDRLTKLAHFLTVRMTYTLKEFFRLYIHEIVPLQKAMETQLTMSTAFHPRTDSQSKKTIKVLEDMLQACILDLKGSWEKHLPLVEFAYNNNYQASI